MNLKPRKIGRCPDCHTDGVKLCDTQLGIMCIECYNRAHYRSLVENVTREHASFWTSEKLEELAQDWPHMHCHDLVAKYQAPFGGIKQQARQLRVRRPSRLHYEDRQYYTAYRIWPGLPGPPEAWGMTLEEWNADPDEWHRELCRKYA